MATCGLMAGHAACCAAVGPDAVPLIGSLYRCGSWSPRPQPLGSGGDTTPTVKTQGRTMNCYFNRFNLLHQVLLSVWVLSVEQGPTVTSVVTGPSSWN